MPRITVRRMATYTILVGLLAFALYIWYGQSRAKDVELGNLHIDVSGGKLKVSSHVSGDESVLQGNLGLGTGSVSPETCDPGPHKAAACVLWEGTTYLHVTPETVPGTEVQCHRIQWLSLRRDHEPKDCFDMDGSQWYGGSEFYAQRWPINAQEIPLQQYRSADYLMNEDMHTQHGPILEPYWFNSRGVAIFVDGTDVLHVGMNENNDGRLCLSASKRGTTTGQYEHYEFIDLSYLICQAANAKEIHTVMAKHFLDRPTTLPDTRMLKSPIWSTWARYKVHVNQTNVLQYADEIEKHRFSHSQIEIDDMYTTTYGDFDFNVTKFPSPKQMVSQLHDRSFRVTCWVTPFANLDSRAFMEGINNEYWITDSTGRVPGLVKWWQGTGAILDVTNPQAVDWFVSRLNVLKHDIGVDSFKFDAGEVSHLPPHVGTHVPLDNPGDYTTNYAHAVHRLGPMVEMRAAYRSQKLGLFTRMMDKDSVWGFSNGLQTLIPTALMMSVTGYHYILPDMIGGNGYGDTDVFQTSTLPDKELFIRWVQLSAFLPAMQFSFTPWQYDADVIQISREMIRVHEERVTPIILEAASEMLKSGTPIIRPIWWLDPDDEDALSNESEFLVGNAILVAPMLTKGATRDIYLPQGEWTDDLTHRHFLGNVWLRNYKVELGQIPTFTHKN